MPSYWSIGAYVAVLTTADGYRSHVPFTVRDDHPRRPAPAAAGHHLAGVQPLPGGRPYRRQPVPRLGRGGPPARRGRRGHHGLLRPPVRGRGPALHVGHAYDFIRWAERYGYDLAYADSRDLHAGRIDPTRYRGLVFPGHDEYWSVPMRRAVEDARDRGTSLVFLSANTMYWQVELGPSASGVPDRLLTCRKRKGPGRPVLWREIDRPEQQLVGIQYAGRVPEPHPLIVRNGGHWLWEATGAHEGDAIEGLVAGEADRYFPRTPLPEHDERILLAHSPVHRRRRRPAPPGDVPLPGPLRRLGVRLGTFAWSPALDRPEHVDARIQRATANLLDRICKRD